MKADIGVVGLGTMGRALAQNFLSRGYTVAGFNRHSEVTKKLAEENTLFVACESLEEFVNALKPPKKLILMVPAGKIVDDFIDELLKLLKPADIIMDGGNSFFKDTIRRFKNVSKSGVHYFGVGISGGESGARFGPSIMPGGDKNAYEQIAPYLEAVAAKKDGDPCVAYIGNDGAGHYVKMVHNGIEYADMQLLAETYLLLMRAIGLKNEQMADVFEGWQDTDVSSYLVGITSIILREKEEGKFLVDVIQDSAGAKGTGKWTTLDSIENEHNSSLIAAALIARITSNEHDLRKIFASENIGTVQKIPEVTTDCVRRAYELCKLVAYAQGFSQMSHAAKQYGWELNLEDIASIFREGCIIKAELLQQLMKLYENSGNLDNFLTSSEMIERIRELLPDLRRVCTVAIKNSIPVPVFAGALTYLDQLTSSCVGANLIQAQRDYFGAHTFLRTDKEGVFHHEWTGR